VAHERGDWPARWRLSTRITLVALTALVPLLIVLLLSYAETARQRREKEVADAELIGQTVAAVVDGFARDIEGTLLAAAIGIGSRAGPLNQETVGVYFDVLTREYPALRALFLLDPSGRVVAAQRGEGIGTNLSGRPYVEQLRAGAEQTWSLGLVGAQTGEVTVIYGRVVRGPDGATRGYLMAAHYPPQLLDRLNVRTPPDADISFYDARGFLMHSTARPDLPLEKRDASGSPRLQEALAGQVVRIDGTTNLYEGEERYGTLVPVKRLGWVVAFSRPGGPLAAELRAQVIAQAVATAMIVAVVATVLYLLTRRLTQPLKTLAAAAAAIARGERPEVPKMHADADVAQLAAGIAAMSAAVGEREDALRLQTRELENAVMARDQFLSIASHELKTPMTAIKGNVDLLARVQRRGEVPPERLARLTGAIASATDRLARLTEDLLDVSRIRSGRLELRVEQVNLAALVTRIAEGAPLGADERPRVNVDAPEPPPIVEADPDRLEQVVQNLVDNALKYSPNGEAVSVRLQQEGESVVLSVADRGIGLPPGAAETIFEPFGRAANATERHLPGMGLGLFISRGIVDQHGGELWAESPGVDLGTTVRVRLPTSPSATGSPAAMLPA
jgi:signal transduction histidine kinase